MSGWSCPHQTHLYICQRVKVVCKPGMKGCVLRGKVRFAGEECIVTPPDPISSKEKREKGPRENK